MSPTSAKARSADGALQPQNSLDSKQVLANEVLTEEVFCRMIALERKRSERTQRPFVLLLMDTGHTPPTERNGRILLDILSALQTATRETDVMGWYETNSAVGVMFTEITLENNLILSTILARISHVLRHRLTNEQFSQIKFSFHLFPEEWDPSNPEKSEQPDTLSRSPEARRDKPAGANGQARHGHFGKPAAAGSVVPGVFRGCRCD